MEDLKLEDWWVGGQSVYSLKNYKEKPVYKKFKNSTRPFSKVSPDSREAFWRDDNCYIYEWFETSTQTGEKFGLDHNSTTYFYEHWHFDAAEDCHIVEKSWLSGPSEWGVVIKYYRDREEEVSWSQNENRKEIEKTTRKPDGTQAIKKGQEETPEGIEDFTELFWKTPTGYTKEKHRVRGSAKTDEKEFGEGDKRWGNIVTQDVNEESKRQWNEEGDHKWGEAEGVEGYEAWKEKWDRDADHSFEEIEHKCKFRYWGKERKRSKSHAYQIEWEDVKPEVVLPGSASEPDKKVKVSDELAFKLDNLYKDLSDDVRKKLDELQNSDQSALDPEVGTLIDSYVNLSEPEALNPDEALAAINNLRDLDKKIDSVKGKVLDSQPTSKQLDELFQENYGLASALHPILDKSEVTEAGLDLQNINREYGSATSPKDKVRIIGSIGHVVGDLIEAGKREHPETAEEVAQTTNKLHLLLLNFLPGIKQSVKNLEEIKDDYKPHDEVLTSYVNAYKSRENDITNGVENSLPYNQVLPKISSLINDIEKFKKEITDNGTKDKLKKIRESQAETGNALAENLGVPPEVIISFDPNIENLSDLVDDVDKANQINNALAGKIIGKDISGGIPEIDSVPARDPEEAKLPIDPIELLKTFWVLGKQNQDVSNKFVDTLASTVGNEDENQKLGEIKDALQQSLTGIVPEKPKDALLQLQDSVKDYFDNKLKEGELAQELADKAVTKVKETEVKPEAVNDLWKSILLSNKISEKLLQNDAVPPALEELRKAVEASPSVPVPLSLLYKFIVKYQENNLGLVNQDPEATEEELKDLDDLSNKRAGGKGKKGITSKPKKGPLRTGRPTYGDQMIETLDKSYNILTELASWIHGPKPALLKHLKTLKEAQDPVIELIKKNSASKETIEAYLSLLAKYEDEKQNLYQHSDVDKNLGLVFQKTQKVIDSTAKLLEVDVPSELDELEKRKATGDLSDSVKREAFLLSIYFKMVKEATGVDEEGGENLDDAVDAMKKKQALAILPFDPLQLLSNLKSKKNNDIRRLKFLSELVGSDPQIESVKELETHANNLLDNFEPKTSQEAMENLDTYLQTYPEVEKEIASQTENFLSTLLQKLSNPAPLEKDVGNIIEASEKLALALEKLKPNSSNPDEVDALIARKDSLPSSTKELLPYLTGLVKDYSITNLNLLSGLLNSPLSKDEELKLASETNKKIKAAPVQIVRDVEHLFSGPDTDDVIEIIVKLDKALDNLVKTNSVPDLVLFEEAKNSYQKLDKLSPVEIKKLAVDYSNLLLSLLYGPDDLSHYLEEIEEETTTVRTTRGGGFKSLLSWSEIFKSKGLDINAELLGEYIKEEQKFAVIYLKILSEAFGTPEQKTAFGFLIKKSEEVLQNPDEKAKIENYINLRLEESKSFSALSTKALNLFERLSALDKERGAIVALGISEDTILVENNNPELKLELENIINKEEEYKARNPENISETVLRIAGRLGLEKELNRIKNEAKPTDNRDQELIKVLTELEQNLFSELRSLNNTLIEYSSELTESPANLKQLTEFEVSTSIPALLASLGQGIKNHGQLVSVLDGVLGNTPTKPDLHSSIAQIEAEAAADDTETELVFGGLFRLCGSPDDKNAAKKLRENRVIASSEKVRLVDIVNVLNGHLNKLLPLRSSQSRLQAKLVKEAGGMRDGIDEIDLISEDLLKKAAREIANSILPDDTRSREALDKIRKALEEIDESSPTNIPDCVDRITKRLETWEKLERLRKELRERASKEINRLRAEIQDKINELSTAKATIESQKSQYEAQIALVQNTADLNASLVEKLTQEAVEREKALSELKNSISNYTELNTQLKEDLDRLQDEVDSGNKELRTLRRINKEKEAQIRDLQNSLDSVGRSSEKSSLDDRERSEILDKLRSENKALRDDINGKIKALDELEDRFNNLDRLYKKLELEKSSLDKEHERLKTERNQIRADLMKVSADKSELEEQLKLSEGVNPEEIKLLERILQEKQRELEENEENLIVARRYQVLYPELKVESEELDSKLRFATIKNDELERKIADSRQENEKLKYKLTSLQQIQQETSELQKENKKLQLRLNYLEQSGDPNKVANLGQQLAEDIVNKETQIQNLLAQIEKLQEEIAERKKKHEIALSRSFLVRLIHVFKEQESLGFRRWRSYEKKIVRVKDLFIPAVESPIFVEEKAQLGDIFDEAKQIIDNQSQNDLKSNLAIVAYKSTDFDNEKPISYINLFKFLEELMDKKFDADKKAFSEGKLPPAFPNFLMESLTLAFGVNALVLKFLGQFVPGLHNLCLDGNQYAIFYARLLQFFHPEPVPYSIGLYLVKARLDFHPLIEKYERLLTEQGREVKKKNEVSGRSAYEAAGTGGLASVGDVVELIYVLFSGDRDGGEKVLELIKPAKISIEDFVAFKICHKMAKTGKTPEMIFNLLDKDQGGTIDVNEFINGTKEDLDLWISDKNITKLLDQLDINNNREIPKESFMAKINMKFLMECNKSPLWVVSKSTFLTSLLEVFKYKEIKLIASIIPNVQKYDGKIDEENFGEILNHYELNIKKDNIKKLYDESKVADEDPYSGIASVFVKYGVGDLKSYRIREIRQLLNKRSSILLGGGLLQEISGSRFSVALDDILIDRDVEETTTVKKKVTKKITKKLLG